MLLLPQTLAFEVRLPHRSNLCFFFKLSISCCRAEAASLPVMQRYRVEFPIEYGYFYFTLGLELELGGVVEKNPNH